MLKDSRSMTLAFDNYVGHQKNCEGLEETPVALLHFYRCETQKGHGNTPKR